jgi:hypothetical protein
MDVDSEKKDPWPGRRRALAPAPTDTGTRIDQCLVIKTQQTKETFKKVVLGYYWGRMYIQGL